MAYREPERPQFLLRPTGLQALGRGPRGLLGVRSRSPSARRSCCRGPGNPCLAPHVGPCPGGQVHLGLRRLPNGPHKRPHPGLSVHFLWQRRQRRCPASHLCVSRGAQTHPGGARGTPPRSPSPRAARPAAALHGPAPVSPQAGLPLCAGRAPRPRHWPARPGGQPLPGLPYAYA